MGRNGLQILRFHDSQVSDVRLRAVLREVYDGLNTVNRLLADVLGTDYGKGIVRLKPRVVTEDPTLVTTYGEVGELVYKGGVLYQKIGVTGEDTNWVAQAGKSGTVTFTSSTLAPTSSNAGFALHLQSRQATSKGDRVWAKMQRGDGVWYWSAVWTARDTAP